MRQMANSSEWRWKPPDTISRMKKHYSFLSQMNVYVISESNSWPIYKGVNKGNTIFGHKFALLVTNLLMAPCSITITFQRSIWHSSIHLRWYHPDKVKEFNKWKLMMAFERCLPNCKHELIHQEWISLFCPWIWRCIS